jgi:hypothetical protein
MEVSGVGPIYLEGRSSWCLLYSYKKWSGSQIHSGSKEKMFLLEILSYQGKSKLVHIKTDYSASLEGSKNFYLSFSSFSSIAPHC